MSPNPQTSPYHRPPGLNVPPVARVLMIVAWLGMTLDTLLGYPVIAQLFPDFSEAIIIGLMIGLGAACAGLATKVGTEFNHGNRIVGWLLLVCVLGVGAALAFARWRLGFTGGAVGAETGLVVEHTDTELPATVLMLVLYVASVIGTVWSARKVLVPERRELRRHRAEIDGLVQQLALLEAESVAVHERIGARSDGLKQLGELLTHALKQADARESRLKSFSRDFIARVVGRPDATPLVRAPLEPGAN
ncbi:hypothetical protein FOJ82_13460 [Tessaracoccus rhinocerotis]|uniref:Uncharacterized protein n=1 Tax=Tessaracoccus rhinocerotis TaxID=1689449 RepID=A0A553JWP6_9ACTN|nr:hypothetical protein [Tessaracoccus rhinocerotis]TRY16875.1 hypothetical protein FOJ82_13460 [Tessaracoccus rhinocerotis]